MTKRLMCGAAVRDITPPEELLPGLRGLMGCRFGGIHDQLKVRAIAFSNGVDKALLVQLDMDKDQAPTEVLAYISNRWKIPEENILYFGVHTHSAPMTTGRHELEDACLDEDREYVYAQTKKYEKLIFGNMYDAIEEAFHNMRPAKIGCGKSQSYTNTRKSQDFQIYDKDNQLVNAFCTQGFDTAAAISHEMFVMKVTDYSDVPIAFLINFPMHCVIMCLNGLAGDGKSLISGDVAGNISQKIEAHFPGSVCVWSSGAAGDVNPIPNSYAAYPDPDTQEMKMFSLKSDHRDLLNYMVAVQLMSVKEAINNVRYMSLKSDIKGAIELSSTPKYQLILDDHGNPVKVDKNFFDEETFDVRMQTLRIGDVMLVGIGGELFNSFGEELKEISPLKNTVIITHNVSLKYQCDYIIDDDAIARNYLQGGNGVIDIVPGYLSKSLTEHFCHMIDAETEFKEENK